MTIELYDSRGNLLEHLYQWDRDVELTIKNNSKHKIAEIHFSNLLSKQALVLEPYDRGRRVKVPNLLLTKIHAITAHFCAFNDEGGFETVFEYIIPIRPRQKPEEYVYTETEVLSYKNLENRVSNIENNMSEENVAKAVNEYLSENPVQGIQGPQGEKGDTGEKGEKGADGKDGQTPVKGVDYFTEADKAEITNDVKNSLEAVPDYWKNALEEGAKAINTALCTAGMNKSAFLFYSDCHWNHGSQMSPALLKYLCKHTGMTKTFFGGDIVNNEGTDYGTMEYLWEWRKQLKDLPNHHSVVGNHDDGNPNTIFDENYVYGYLFAAEETPDIVRGGATYYYMDNSAEKTRYIFLDTAFKGMTAAQTEFLNKTLIDTSEGWHIVVISHIWHDAVYPDESAGVTDYAVGDFSSDASVVLAMLDNYNSRSGDYVDCKGWVEFCIGGHTHIDHDSTSETGIPVILVETDSRHTRSGLTYDEGTTNESSVNGIIADYSNHKIHIIRIGRGESREIEVTNYVISYTNVIPFALAADGINIYNEKGYKENTRWSSSGNSEQTTNGIYLTGYIPIEPQDVIRLKNITLTKEASNTCIIHLFKTLDDTNEGNITGDNLENHYTPVWGNDGNLNQITIPSGSAYKYIRIQCDYIGVDSVITINEPIE